MEMFFKFEMASCSELKIFLGVQVASRWEPGYFSVELTTGPKNGHFMFKLHFLELRSISTFYFLLWCLDSILCHQKMIRLYNETNVNMTVK